jgi:hypothetical protein
LLQEKAFLSTKKIFVGYGSVWEEEAPFGLALFRTKVVKSLPGKFMLCGWTTRVV